MIDEMEPPSGVHFRRATSADGEAVRTLIYRVLSEYDMAPSPERDDRDLYDIADVYRGGVFEVLVDEANVIIGTYGLRPAANGVCDLRKMYLSAAHRGKGLGRLLLSRAVAQARALGFGRIELETASALKEAVALYEASGFVSLARGNVSGRCNKVMALDIAD